MLQAMTAAENTTSPPGGERRQHERSAGALPKLVVPRILKQRLEDQSSGDYFRLRNGRDILAYETRYTEAGFSSFREVYAYLVNRPVSDVKEDEPRRVLRPARHIAPEEAWQSDMGFSALRVIAHHPADERAVFFGRARQLTKSGRHGLDMTISALQALSTEVQALPEGERADALRARLKIREHECCAPLVPLCHRPKSVKPPQVKSSADLIKQLSQRAGGLFLVVAALRTALEGGDREVDAGHYELQ